jgi:hypothetical protein
MENEHEHEHEVRFTKTMHMPHVHTPPDTDIADSAWTTLMLGMYNARCQLKLGLLTQVKKKYDLTAHDHNTTAWRVT